MISISLELLRSLPLSIISVVEYVDVLLDHFNDGCLQVVKAYHEPHAASLLQYEIKISTAQ